MSNSFSTFSEEHQKKLDALNAEVITAIRKRERWLDSITVECSKFKPGDAIYDLEKLRLVGTVRKIIREVDNSLDSINPAEFNIDLRVASPEPEHPYGWKYQYLSGLDFTIRDFDCDRYGTKEEYDARLASHTESEQAPQEGS